MSDEPASTDESLPADNAAYWRANLSLVGKLLVVWFLVSFGCGILFVDTLNQIEFGGFKLGFWFAQQGAIYTFIALIFVYARVMARLEARLGLGEQEG